MPGDLLDVILVVLAAAFAMDGYRQGFVVGALGVVGFLCGAAAGAVISPGIAQALVRSPSQQALVAIIVVFLVALAGQLLASLAGRRARYPARVVYVDPRRDIAVLYVPRLPARPLHLAASARRGGEAIVAGYPRGRALTAAPARIGAKVAMGFPTIYGGGVVIRHVYPVRADIQPGNSGSPLLAPDGTVYGMIFAALTGSGDAGYALAAGEVAPAAQAAATRTKAVSTQPWHCPA